MLCNIKPLHPNKDMYILCLYLLVYTFLMVHVQDKESVMAFLGWSWCFFYYIK